MLQKLSNDQKLLWSFLGLLWINFVIFAAFTYFAQRQQLLENALQQLTHQTEITGKTLDEWMSSRLDLVAGLAHEIAQKPNNERESIPQVYFERIAETGLLQYLGYGLENGYYTSNPWPIPDGYDPRQRPWYRTGKQSQQPTISEPYLGVDDYTTTYLAFTAPIIKDNQFHGVVTGDVSFNDIHQKILSTPIIYDGQFNLINSRGNAILRPVDPTDETVAPEYFSTSINSDHLAQTLSLSSTSHYKGDNAIIVFYPLENVDWWLTAEIEKRVLFAPVYRDLMNILLLFLAIALTTILLQKIYARRVYKPILRQLQTDYHTDLPNKNTFIEQIHKLTQSNLKHGLCILLHFKDMSSLMSSYPLSVVKNIQQQTLSRIKNSFVRDYIVGSVSYDQIALFVPFLNSPNSTFIERKLQHLESVLNAPFHVEDDSEEEHIILTAINLASARYPDDAGVFELINRANMALSTLKNSGSHYAQYHHNVLKQLASESELIQAFHNALDNNELSLVFQPQIDCESNQITGVEVLSRWHSQTLNKEIPPQVFIPLAEKHHLIRKLSLWLLHSLFSRINQWLKSELPAPRFAINLSSLNLHDPVFIRQFFQLLKKYNVPAELLQIEVTEHISLEFLSDTNNPLQIMRNHGLSIAIDDFGTGYSSLTYLKYLPIDTIKIDRTFIKSLPGNHSDLALSKAIIDIGNEFDLKVVAEGVETAEQLELLKLHGCHQIQGFLFSKPLTESALLSFVRDWNAQARQFESATL